MRPDPKSATYQFGDFFVDADERQLRRNDIEVTLPAKVFDTLLYLVKNPGRILTKDELIAEVWEGAFVEETNLTSNISRLRKVLHNGGLEFIETLPKRGYRFIGPVERRVRSTEVSVDGGAPDPNSIAVLPFANMSDDPGNEFFCEGLAEELLNALAKMDGIRVAARTSAFFFKGKNLPVSDIAAELNVAKILEGSVRKQDDRIRVTAQLIEAATGYHLWSERYDRSLADIFDVQDEITTAIAEALKVSLLGMSGADRLGSRTNIQAYEAYLKGIHYRWKTEPDEFRKCGPYFHQAVDLDPTFALAYFGLASYYGYGTAFGLLPIPPEEGWARAEAAMQRCLDLAPGLREGVITNAFKMVHYRELDEAGRGIHEAARAVPEFAEIHHLYSSYLLIRGNYREAIDEARRALELDPLSFNYSRALGICYLFSRSYDEAIDQFDKSRDLDPNNPSALELLGACYARKGDLEQAIRFWIEALRAEGRHHIAEVIVNTLNSSGPLAALTTLAEFKVRALDERSRNGELVLAIEYLRAYLQLGDTEKAFEWLPRAVAERNLFPLLFAADPFYDPIRDDPRFQNALRQIGLLS